MSGSMRPIVFGRRPRGNARQGLRRQNPRISTCESSFHTRCGKILELQRAVVRLRCQCSRDQILEFAYVALELEAGQGIDQVPIDSA